MTPQPIADRRTGNVRVPTVWSILAKATLDGSGLAGRTLAELVLESAERALGDVKMGSEGRAPGAVRSDDPDVSQSPTPAEQIVTGSPSGHPAAAPSPGAAATPSSEDAAA